MKRDDKGKLIFVPSSQTEPFSNRIRTKNIVWENKCLLINCAYIKGHLITDKDSNIISYKYIPNSLTKSVILNQQEIIQN